MARNRTVVAGSRGSQRVCGIGNVIHCYYDDVDIEFAFYNSVWNVREKGTIYKSIDDICEQYQYKPFNVEVVEATPKFVIAKTGFGGTVTTSSGRKYWFIRGDL
jgi:hypothetical protein